MVYEVENTETVKDIFGGWEETLIWSCLQKVMGKIYTQDLEKSDSAMAVLGDFIFFAGKPEKELVLYSGRWCSQGFMILVGQNEEWGLLIRQLYKEKAKPVFRYAIKKEKGIFDSGKLQKAVSQLSGDYRLCLIDEKLYELCRAESWSLDLVSQFKDYDEYKKLGLGVVALKDGKIVSGASSYSRYREGIEIEIDTKEEYRRKGLAYACGAKLILECMKRNLYPSWDAQNLWSVALAEKLGYHFSHEYRAYEIG